VRCSWLPADPVGLAEAEDVWAEATAGARPATTANATEVKGWRRMTVFLGWATFGDGPSPGLIESASIGR
jgi:hypothetical protein